MIASKQVNINMVYISDTFELCHKLTPLGKERYEQLLEKEADKILWKAEHPVLAFADAVKDFLNI